MKKITIEISPVDIVNNFTADEIIKLYGGHSFLLSDRGVFMHELVNKLDKDQLLDAIGKEAVLDWLLPEEKKVIA